MSSKNQALADTLKSELRAEFKLMAGETNSRIDDLNETVRCKVDLLSGKIDLIVSCFLPKPKPGELEMRLNALEAKLKKLKGNEYLSSRVL